VGDYSAPELAMSQNSKDYFLIHKIKKLKFEFFQEVKKANQV